MKKQMIPMDKLKSISIEMEGTQYCYKGKVIINGIEPNKGVGTIDLHLVANKKPQVTIFGTPRLIPSEVNESWGLSDKNWQDVPNELLPKLTEKEHLSLHHMLEQLSES